MRKSDMFIQYIQIIDEPNQSKCLQLYLDNKERFDKAPGSLVKHQAWEGGYLDHMIETMEFAFNLHVMMKHKRVLPFTIPDALLVLFLHDLEKPFKYVEPKTKFGSDKDKEDFIEGLIHQYGIVLTAEQKNALKYIHGEGNDYSPTERIQGPLAAFCHMCDVASARIWPEGKYE